MASPIYKTTPPSPPTKMAREHLSNSTPNWTGAIFGGVNVKLNSFPSLAARTLQQPKGCGWDWGEAFHNCDAQWRLPRNDGRKTNMDLLNQGMIDNKEAIKLYDVLICFVFMLVWWIHATSLSITTSSYSFPLMNVVEWKQPQECHPELMETRGCMEKECPTWDAEVLAEGIQGVSVWKKWRFFGEHFGSWGDVLVFENLMDPIGLTMIRLIERNLEPVDTSR